ncbi:YunG family protein [Roseibium polysiphoniae]|uniref:Uncharacterized protein n=1 Tax=Roseibium polysiphoniae TaxID=2571221 RepID=A0ABR9CG81_9HYPH|nr:hypothetical protein [Roseibium polysiphoniae]MBD8877971.1 hypothetical protein [Roseibium polysiphoniae]
MALVFDEAQIRAALKKAWSLETAVQWTEENPALGQCNVTAAVIEDLFGGEILRTALPGVMHYYNRIDRQTIDFTDSQFSGPRSVFEAPSSYDHELTTHDAAMVGIPRREFDTLKEALIKELSDPTR